MSQLTDLTGQKFERLIVLSRSNDYIAPSGYKKACWLCRCDCRKEVIVVGCSLKRGYTQSCGCKNMESRKSSSNKHKVHGQRNTRLYRIWQGMKRRCGNPNYSQYKDYGGRGISVCKEWKESFEKFRDWAISNGYSDKLSIDRIEQNGNYEPTNCRWADKKTQTRNRRNTIMIEAFGESLTVEEWSEKTGIPYSTIMTRRRKGIMGEKLFEGKRVIKEEK